MKFVLMAGGTGSKLWPMSRANAPKQFIKIVGEKTLFQESLESLLRKYKPEDIFVSTTEELKHFVEEQGPQILKENYIIEPVMRDTGPASCLAMAKVAARYPDEVVYFYVQVVCTRDPAEKFLDMLEVTENLVKDTGKLVTGTIIPKYTETGSDLMKLGEERVLDGGIKAFQIEEFFNVVKERWPAEKVEDLYKNNTVGTHTNHLTWRPKEFFEAVKKYRPDWFDVIERISQVLGKEEETAQLKQLYPEFEAGRIELITTELIKEGRVMTVELPFEWWHITTWDDVYRYRIKKGLPEIEGEVIEVDSKNNLILNQGKKLVSVVGMEDVVVVETGDVIFIAPKTKAAKVKEITEKLVEMGKGELV